MLSTLNSSLTIPLANDSTWITGESACNDSGKYGETVFATSGTYGNCLTTFPPKYVDLLPRISSPDPDVSISITGSLKKRKGPTIKKVIFSYPATIVLWSDGAKTVVKCGENDNFDPEKGLALAIAKRFMGNKGNYYNEFKKWIPKAHKDIASTLSKSKPIGKVVSKGISDEGVKVTVQMNPEDTGLCPGFYMINCKTCTNCPDRDSCKAIGEECNGL